MANGWAYLLDCVNQALGLLAAMTEEVTIRILVGDNAVQEVEKRSSRSYSVPRGGSDMLADQTSRWIRHNRAG